MSELSWEQRVGYLVSGDFVLDFVYVGQFGRAEVSFPQTFMLFRVIQHIFQYFGLKTNEV